MLHDRLGPGAGSPGSPAEYRQAMLNQDGPAPGDRPGGEAGLHDDEALSAALAVAGIDPGAIERATVDRATLAVGLRLGLEHPDRARRLLEALDNPEPAGETETATIDAARSPVPPAGDKTAGEPVGDGAAGDAVPVRSMLLARSAAMVAAGDITLDPDAMFGWAGRLTRDEILTIGRVVGDMIARGGSKDLARGFGVTWTGGVHVPGSGFEATFHAFTELQVTVCGVLAGHDLRAEPQASSPGLMGSLFGSLLPRADPVANEAASVMDRAGEPGQHGLVALWNAWAAMRYRSAIPEELFEQLVHPWVTVVGPLPER